MAPLSQEGIKVVFEYQHLEQRVRQLTLKICGSFCRSCHDRCCNKDYCSESLESYWLRMTWGSWGHHISEYDISEGWLSPGGCQLEVGRPPVCYEFLCRKILTEIQEKNYLAGFKGISNLVSFAGRNALGNRHLITLSPEQILKRINFERLRRKIGQAHSILNRCEAALVSFCG